MHIHRNNGTLGGRSSIKCVPESRFARLALLGRSARSYTRAFLNGPKARPWASSSWQCRAEDTRQASSAVLSTIFRLIKTRAGARIMSFTFSITNLNPFAHRSSSTSRPTEIDYRDSTSPVVLAFPKLYKAKVGLAAMLRVSASIDCFIILPYPAICDTHISPVLQTHDSLFMQDNVRQKGFK